MEYGSVPIYCFASWRLEYFTGWYMFSFIYLLDSIHEGKKRIMLNLILI